MKKYYVNKRAQNNGDHEVHDSGCSFLPLPENRQYLGEYSSCKGAVTEAKKTYTSADGCKFCSNECHNS
ncbi:hypothetical protein ACVWYN_001706 [Pedobacter sp. UYP24]